MLKARDSGGAPCKTVRALAGEKLEQIEAQMKELVAFPQRVDRECIEDWDRRLAGASPGKPAASAGSLAATRAPSRHRVRKKSLDPGTGSTLHTLRMRREP